MDEYIKKSDAQNATKQRLMFPVGDFATVVHGKWIPYKISDLFKATCSICHVDAEERYPCCPYCRTIMDL